MTKKQRHILIPILLLLLAMAVLVGCRPSDALTRLMNAANALNPGTEEMLTDEEDEDQTPDDDVDPIDEERDDAELDEIEDLIGQMLENMDEETAQESLMAVYSASAENGDWGAQQYNPDNLNFGSGALVLNVSGDEVNSNSRVAGSGEGRGTGAALTLGDDVSSDGEDADLHDYTEEGGNGTNPGSGNTAGGPVAGQENYNEPTGDEPTGDETTGDETTGDETTGDETTGDETTGDETTGDDPHGHRIAATGQAATLVCMLGGADRLCAAGSDWYYNEYVQRAFGDDLVDCVPLATWTDTSIGSADYGTLLGDIKPDMIVEIGGKTILDSNDVESHEIDYYATYPLTSEENITTYCVPKLAERMDDGEGTKTASTIAGNYVDWVFQVEDYLDQEIKDIKETIFIEGWDPDVATNFTVDQWNIQGDAKTTELNDVPRTFEVATGAAYIKIGYNFRPLKDYMWDAKICDWAVAPHQIGVTLTENYYRDRTASNTDFYGWLENNHSFSGANAGDLCYVSPVYNKLYAASLNGGSQGNVYLSGDYYQSPGGAYFTGGRSNVIKNIGDVGSRYAYDFIMGTELSFGYLPIFDDSFPVVIAKTQDVANQIVGSQTWQTNGTTGTDYTPHNYSYTYIPDLFCTTWDLGTYGTYYVQYNTCIGNRNYSVDDSVVVNPCGLLGDWVEGSPESILESVWLAATVQGVDVNVDNMIYDFYSTFYGLELNAKDLQKINDGAES